jgi:hypothetical protein
VGSRMVHRIFDVIDVGRPHRPERHTHGRQEAVDCHLEVTDENADVEIGRERQRIAQPIQDTLSSAG